MIQMHMVTGERKPSHVMAATSICDAVNVTLSSLQSEDDYNPEDIRRVETHLSREKESKWVNDHFEDGFVVYQYIAFIWINE